MPMVWSADCASPGPRNTITPISPITTPATRRVIKRSSPKLASTSTVNSGVVALSTEASPLET